MIKKIQKQFKDFSSHISGVIVIYTFFWLLLAGMIIFIFYKNGKSFLFINDGVYQHFSSFNYLCDYLKDLLYNFHFPGFFNFTLGQGMDILTTLNSYDFTDPICVLCALMLPISRVGRYTLMIFIKLYLIGISFLFYCYTIERKQGLATISGALAYAFCGAVLFMFARHPNYINWAYFLPFLLGGVELYFRKRIKFPLILFVFLNIITSYYTFYINVVLIIIYVAIHIIYRIVKGKSWDILIEEFIECVKLVGVCCIGVLLSSFILFPSIYAYLNNNRIGELTGYTASALHFDGEYYKNIFEQLFTPTSTALYTSVIGINVALIIPLTLIYTKKGQFTTIKALFLVSLIMLGIPMVGRILNGFGYVTNRWAYVIPFYASVILVLMFTEIGNATRKEKAFILLVTTLYVVICFLNTETNTNILKCITLSILIAIVAVTFIALHYKYPSIEFFVFSLVILGSCFLIYGTFSENKGNYVSEYLDEVKVAPSYTNYSSTAARNISGNDSFYRTEMEERRTNVNGVNNVKGTGFYWSMVPGDMMDYHTDLALDSVSENCNVWNLDGRSGLLELASVKYYTRPVEEEGLIPYGYNEIPSTEKKFQVFENEYALPIGYTYSCYISETEYEKMNGIEREQALLQGAILEGDIKNLTEINAQFDYDVLDYNITNTRGIKMKENCIEPLIPETDVETDDNIIREVDIQADVPVDCEIYLYISGINIGEESETLPLTVSRTTGKSSIKKYANLHNLNFNWPSMQDDVTFNLGSGYTDTNNITLSLEEGVSLFFDDIKIIAVPMSTYEEYAEQLGEYVLEDVSVGEDQINGTIAVPGERILQFSIPYSDGWKAYVDGEEVSIMKSDVMYMAIPISAGSHDIELRYETPYLRIGLVVSIATAILFAAYEFINHTRKKHIGVRGNE